MQADPTPGRWHPATRLAFRLAALYLGGYIAVQFLGGLAVVRVGVSLVGRYVFGIAEPLTAQMTGSGDQLVHWVTAASVLLAALAGTVVWSVLDRRRPDYAVLLAWSSLVVRLWLGMVFASYGALKIFPLQMPAPSLARLLQPFGTFSPMGVLWTSVGASHGYESFTGAAELTAAVLLFIPRTSLAGALVALACATQIFVLNMTYDVPVKLFSFHLVLASIFLLAPDARRLSAALLSRGPVAPSTRVIPGRTPRRALIISVAQMLIGALLVGGGLTGAATSWHVTRRNAASVPYYGIWTVESVTRAGEPVPLLVTDPQQWRQIIFERAGMLVVRRMSDQFAYLPATVNDHDGRIVFPARVAPVSEFTVTRPDDDHLVLEGEQGDEPVRYDLTRLDHTALLLPSRGFHWIQEYPFNR